MQFSQGFCLFITRATFPLVSNGGFLLGWHQSSPCYPSRTQYSVHEPWDHLWAAWGSLQPSRALHQSSTVQSSLLACPKAAHAGLDSCDIWEANSVCPFCFCRKIPETCFFVNIELSCECKSPRLRHWHVHCLVRAQFLFPRWHLSAIYSGQKGQNGKQGA